MLSFVPKCTVFPDMKGSVHTVASYSTPHVNTRFALKFLCTVANLKVPYN